MKEKKMVEARAPENSVSGLKKRAAQNNKHQ
jgi:hypothetical protein